MTKSDKPSETPCMTLPTNTDGPVWDYFGLTYSAYLVLPRVALCSMPLEWQEKFVALMRESEELLPEDAQGHEYWVRRREGNRFVPDPLRNYRHHPVLKLRNGK